ncbi:MAG TPA: PilZ domain-containing protein [Candidatus Tenderia electrophaga]|uniref:PilZ domain-containing protein n=1 Tax=Candidatus Tenderia electrophaga TaxID=1748243 RepID=A0A832J6G3_9GAMM|nr:PilZ domain-containing protein [Candidatus Tenderia electrophaga]
MAFDSFYSKENNSNSVIESMIVGKTDQRGFLRMDIKSKITFRIHGKNNVFEATSNDLSATGISFTSKQQVNEGDLLEVHMKPGIDITPPLAITIKVIRAIATDDGKYEIAGAIQE